MEIMRVRPPDRFLVHDEVTQFRLTPWDVPYRIRVWRGNESAPVALVSHVVDGSLWPGPSAMTAKIANYVHAGILGFPHLAAMYYFEDEHKWDTNERMLFQCPYDRFGNGQRLRLHNFERNMRPWALIEHLLRQKVDR